VTGQHGTLEAYIKKENKNALYGFFLVVAKLIMPVGEWGIYIITVLMVTA